MIDGPMRSVLAIGRIHTLYIKDMQNPSLGVGNAMY
jgi:hypothetical protein